MWRWLGALGLAVSAMGDAGAATLDRIRQAGEIRLGYRADAPPYSYRDAQGQPAGFIVELCQEVAKGISAASGQGIRTTYVPVPATERFQTVLDGKVDILCDPSSVTLERRELVDFSIPTFVDGASLLFRANQPVQGYESLQGRRVGVLARTTSEETLRNAIADLGLKVEIVTAPDHRAGIDLLTSNRIDAYFGDRAILQHLMREGRLAGFQLSRQYFSYETYALALPRDDSAFRLLVDRTLARLYRGGRINDLLARVFGQRPQDEVLKTMILINALPDR